MTPPRRYSGQTRHVAALLGKRVKHARKRRRMTEAELAERVGVSHGTVRAIEQGSLKDEVGLFFEAAVNCGVTLFADNPTELAAQVQRIDDRLCLLPNRIRSERREVDDDF